MASTARHLDCVQSLVTHGADLMYIDMEGRPIIYVLAVENKPAAMRLLHDAGAGKMDWPRWFPDRTHDSSRYLYLTFGFYRLWFHLFCK